MLQKSDENQQTFSLSQTNTMQPRGWWQTELHLQAVDRQQPTDDALLQTGAKHDGVVGSIHTALGRPSYSSAICGKADGSLTT